MKSVLLVDDDPEVLSRVSTILAEAGYHVATETNGKAAIDALQVREVDLVISDINMPGCSGIELLDWINANGRKSKVVLFTGFTDENDAREAIGRGCSGFLAKPLSKQEIVSAAAAALGSYEDGAPHAQDFVNISIEDFICGQKVGFPVYLQVGANKFLKVAHTGMHIDLERVRKFKEDGVRELWLAKEDMPRYLDMSQALARVALASASWPFAKKLRLLRHASEIAFENLRISGVNESAVSTYLETVSAAAEESTRCESVFEVFEVFAPSEETLYARAVMGTVFCRLVARVMGWTAQKSTQLLLAGAALRDVGLLDDPTLASAPPRLLPPELRVNYESHPGAGMEKLKAIPSLQRECLTIVLEHHEDGSPRAFPRKLARSAVFPMARIVHGVDQFVESYLAIPKAARMETEARADLLHLLEKGTAELTTAEALRALLTHGSLKAAQAAYEARTTRQRQGG